MYSTIFNSFLRRTQHQFTEIKSVTKLRITHTHTLVEIGRATALV